jgi:SAM-dependent methyltransferase
VLARARLPQAFAEWNARWGAPFGSGRGHLAAHARGLDRRCDPEGLLRRHGPFVLQPSSSTRRYEYPWAFAELSRPDVRQIVEVGGGLSGLQFALSHDGRDVINVDPGDAGFPLDAQMIPLANELLGTSVELRQCTLREAGIAEQSADIVLCLSTLEHLDPDQVAEVLVETRRILRPRGRFVLSVDLFLNVTPFAANVSNMFGTNHPVWPLLEDHGFNVTDGVPGEVFGSPSFDTRTILGRLHEFLIADSYPALAQLVVASPRP